MAENENKISLLNDKYFRKYGKYFHSNYNKYKIISSKLLYNYFYGDEKCASLYSNEYIDKALVPLINLEKIKGKGNPSFNFQTVIINNKYKSKALIISRIAGVIYRLRFLKYLNKYDLFLQGDTSPNKKDKMLAYRDITQINHIYSSHEQDQYVQSLRDLQKGTLDIQKYKLVSCHYSYITGLPLAASYRILIVLPDIISSLGVAFKTLEAGGTLILFWTIINVHVPSVQKILTLLGFAFDSIRVITDDINQNFFQGVPEYYLECKGYKANLSADLINQLLEVGIRGIDYSYRICDILDYYDQYSQKQPDQCLFYKNSEKPSRASRVSGTNSRITKQRTSKSSKSKSLRISQFLASASRKSQSQRKTRTHRTSKKHSGTRKSKQAPLPEIKYIEDFNLPKAEWDSIKSDAETGYKVMILGNRLEGIFIDFFERVNSMIANDLEVNSHGEHRVREQAITQRKVNDIRRFVNMLETNNIAYNKHLLTILKEQEDELLGQFYTLDNTINTRLIRYRDPQTRDLIKYGFRDIKLGAPFELDFMNTCFDKINLAYRVKENMKMVLGIGAGERVPKIVQEGYEDMTRSLPQYITVRYNSTLPAIKISNAFTKLWEILSVFGALIPSSKSKSGGGGAEKFRVFHICEAPGQMIISLKYFLEKKRKNIVDYDWYANSLNPYNKENQDIYGKGTIFADDYGLIRGNPKKWIWGADGTGDITRVKNIKWYRNVMKSGGRDGVDSGVGDGVGSGVDMIVGDGGLSTQSGVGLDPLVLQKLDLAQVVMVLACSKKGGSCVIKHFTPYIKKHTSTYSAAGFFIGFLYLYYLAFAEVSLFKPYTSNPDSGEFYVIGQGFLGVDDESLERLYKILERIELNQSIISEDKIPETFVLQISGFLERITNLNVMSIEKQNLLLTCYKDGQNQKLKKYLKCDNFLDKDNLQNIQRPRFEEWIKRYGFV
jgi:hypothetical protein